VKSRPPIERATEAAQVPPKRRAALIGLTAACVLAHAAVLGGLPRPAAAPAADHAQRAVMHLTQLTVAATPDAPAVDGAAAPARTQAAPASPSRQRAAPARVEAAAPAVPPSADEVLPPALPPAVADAAIEHLPTSALDTPPMPRSAPDEQYVEHVHRSGLPIRVRLYIDAIGSVTETSLLGAAPGDEEAADQVMTMFRDTAFSPGRLQGREVASYIDIELVLEPTLPPLGRIVRH
jgi:hypothetical protein